MIAGWKVKRELLRLQQQLKSLPEAVWEPAAQRRHDVAFAQFPCHQGAKPMQGKVALFLIWQPSNLAPSVLTTCRHLSAQGYAVLAVCNQGLNQTDLPRVLSESWKVLERPNYGYDFGGYRDGLRLLRTLGVHPERLVILNDSVWYPLFQNDTLLAESEQSKADITGTILRQRGQERFLESYFYSIRGSVLDTHAFVDFWENYRLTSNKYKVIRRGERGFSHAMLAAGVKLEGLFRENDFLAAVEATDEPLLRSTLAYAAFADHRQAGKAHALAKQGTRAQMIDFIRMSLGNHQFYSTYPVAAHRLMGYPVLKKSMEPVSLRWRHNFVCALNGGILPMTLPGLLSEIRSKEDATTPQQK